MDDKRIRLLRDEKISKAINKMSIPAIIGLLVMGIYNFVDTMFVAWLGTEATGATQVVMPIMMLISTFGLAFGMGGGSYVSRLLGNGEKEKANRVGAVSLYSSLFLGVLFTITCLLFMEPLLTFFGASSAVMDLAKKYGLFIILGSIFSMGNMTMNNLLRSEGSAKLSMIGMATGAIINIILDPIFIFGLNLGIAGAAMATSLSQVITFIILASRYMSHHSVLRVGPKHFRPSIEIYSEILKVGIPTFLRQLFFSVSLGILNQGANTYGGPDLLAAVGLIFKIVMVPMYVIFGVGQGFQPVAGYNYGAKNKERVVAALVYSTKLTIIISLVSGILMIVFDEAILSIFRPSAEVVAFAVKGMFYYGIGMVIMAVSNNIAVFYQALGKGKESLVLAIARQGFIFIPVILIMPNFIGADGILSAQLISDIVTLFLTAAMFIPFMNSGKIEAEMSLDVEAV